MMQIHSLVQSLRIGQGEHKPILVGVERVHSSLHLRLLTRLVYLLCHHSDALHELLQKLDYVSLLGRIHRNLLDGFNYLFFRHNFILWHFLIILMLYFGVLLAGLVIRQLCLEFLLQSVVVILTITSESHTCSYQDGLHHLLLFE